MITSAMIKSTIHLKSLLCVIATMSITAPVNAAADYPTVAVADYVFACMKANGETRAVLESCACSIDVIASIVPYERYEAAETFKRMGLLSGERGVVFRDSAPAKAATTDLKRAQAEADVRCF